MIIKPMSLYTPVEIAKSRLEESAKVRPYSIQKYQGNPFQESKSTVQSLTDQKKKIIHWLRSMSVLERQDKFSFLSKDFVTLLRIMHDKRRRHSDRSFRITEQPESHKLIVYGKQNTYRLQNADVDSAEEELIRNVVVLSSKTLFDSVSLSEPILKNLDKLFEIFEILEDGVSNELTVEEYRALDKEGSEAFFYRKDETDHYKKSLGKWLIEVLKKKLWCEYYRNLEEPAENRRPRERKRLNKTWKEWTPAERRNEIRLCSYKDLYELLSRERTSERIRLDILPNFKIPSEPQFQQFIHHLVHHNDLQIFQYLTQCTLEQASQPIHLIKFPLLYILLQNKRKTANPKEFLNPQIKQAAAQKKKKMKPKRKKTEKGVVQTEKSAITAPPETNEKKAPQMRTPPKMQSKQQNKKQPKTDTKQYRGEAVKVEHKEHKEHKEPKINKQQVAQEKEGGNNNNSSFMGTPQKVKKSKKYVESDGNLLKDLGKAQSCTSNQTNQTAHKQQELTEQQIQTRRKIIQDIYRQKQKNDILQVSDSISQTANLYHPYRIVAFNRLQFLLNSLGVSLKIFGSCATGLALANSDIDLAVDPSILNYYYAVFATTKEKICMALGAIMKMIENRNWVSNVKFISTASVPILKFEINPNIAFEQNPKDPNLNTKQKQKSRKVLIKVDLTIQSFYSTEDSSMHLGIMATNSMKEWMSQYPTLRAVSIILKDLLKRRDLNNIYKGGISSYSLIVMLIAFLHSKGLTEQWDPSKVFYGFLEFLCHEFEHQKYGFDISLGNPTFPFFEIDTPLTGKVQVKDPLNGKIVTGNSYQYDKILQEFEAMGKCRLRARDDLDKYIANPTIRLPEKGKYFPRNYLQQYLAGT